VLDKLGQRTGIIDPRGIELAETDSDWATTTRKGLVAAGKLDSSYLTTTGGPAKGYQSLTDAQKTTLRGLYTTTQVFDAQGRVTQVKDPLGGMTDTAYDAFGNAIKVTDPNRNSGYFYFNQFNQATFQIDPMGYATQTAYDSLGLVTSITKYANKVSNFALITQGGASGDVPPAISWSLYDGLMKAGNDFSYFPYLVKSNSSDTTAPQDATTKLVHDLLGRQTQITDAEGYSEYMTYDALGNKLTYTNKLGGTFTYTYDRKGNLKQETLPVQVYQYDASQKPILGSDGKPVLNDVKNVYTYDARGNRTKAVEASTLKEERTTTYTYDALDRMLTKTGQSMSIYTSGTGAGTATPTQTLSYDKRGNLIETKTADGARTLN
ncbi:MAG: RHS repeat protein, partial [Proteobacteria bacterium]